MQGGILSRSYDGEDHLTSAAYGRWGLASGAFCSGHYPTTVTMNYSWGPNGHPLKIGVGSQADSLHWDGDGVLFTTNSAGSVDDIKIGMLADVTPLDPAFTGLTIWDRSLSGTLDSAHNFTGHRWLAGDYLHQEPCQVATVQASPGYLGPSSVASPTNASTGRLWVGTGAVLGAPGSDGYSDGLNILQGVRSYDPEAGQWTTPDAFAGTVHDPVAETQQILDRLSNLYQDLTPGFGNWIMSVNTGSPPPAVLAESRGIPGIGNQPWTSISTQFYTQNFSHYNLPLRYAVLEEAALYEFQAATHI
jgi:hypothetical protein